MSRGRIRNLIIALIERVSAYPQEPFRILIRRISVGIGGDDIEPWHRSARHQKGFIAEMDGLFMMLILDLFYWCASMIELLGVSV